MLFQTIADMQAEFKANLTDGDIAYVASYEGAANPGPDDGGGGHFQWFAASTDAADAGLCFESSESGTGRWKRIYRYEALSPRHFGAKADLVANDQDAVDRLLDALGGSGATGRYTTYWPYGAYAVDQVRFDKGGTTHQFDGSLICGVATSAKASVVDLRGGQSSYHGLRVQASGSTDYACGVHWYASKVARDGHLDWPTPGYLDIYDLQINEAQIGLMIGALPTQEEIHFQDPEDETPPDDIAINAPLSESVIFGLRTIGCLTGLRMRQPNGKVTIVGGRIHAEGLVYDSETDSDIGTWANHPQKEQSVALVLEDEGSELALIGGTLEHVMSQNHGYLMLVTAGRLDVIGTAVETNRPSYIAGRSNVTFTQIANFGHNYDTRPCFELGPDFDGTLCITKSRLTRPTDYGRIGFTPVAKSLAGFEQGFLPNLSATIDFVDVELRDCSWRPGGASYVPLVLGVRARFSRCTLTSFQQQGEGDEAEIVRTKFVRLHDGPDRLAPQVDIGFASIAGYAQTGDDVVDSGWRFRVSGSGSQWGKDMTGLPEIDGHAIPAWLRLTAGSGGSCTAESAKCPNKATREGAHIVRGLIKTGTSTAGITIEVEHFDFDDTSLGTSVLFDGPESAFGATAQPLLFYFEPPADARKFALRFSAEDGADLRIALPEVN